MKSTMEGMCKGFIAAILVLAILLNGCDFSGKARPVPGGEPVDPSRLALLDIGERAMEKGEHHARAGQVDAALQSYRKALWAFEYHHRLTGESPLFLEDVQDSIRRLEAAPRP